MGVCAFVLCVSTVCHYSISHVSGGTGWVFFVRSLVESGVCSVLCVVLLGLSIMFWCVGVALYSAYVVCSLCSLLVGVFFAKVWVAGWLAEPRCVGSLCVSCNRALFVLLEWLTPTTSLSWPGFFFLFSTFFFRPCLHILLLTRANASWPRQTSLANLLLIKAKTYPTVSQANSMRGQPRSRNTSGKKALLALVSVRPSAPELRSW